MIKHKKYMQRCLDLAMLGHGTTSPNPMVGSVIVHNDKIIGEGYHIRSGGPHAEVNALNSVKDTSLLTKSTLYVNLEPCFHTGKTPPCCDLILEKKIKKVIVGSIDPNPLVAGKSIEKLKNNGVEVITDVLHAENEFLNRRFFKFIRKKQPYVILKWAQTRDGFIDIIRDTQQVDRPTWITNESSRMLVHKWRSEEDAILVGTNTALMDNPGLDVRDWSGKNPTRIILDRYLRLPSGLKCFNKRVETIIFNETKAEKKDANIEYFKINFDDEVLDKILVELAHRKITSVIIEGGRKTLEAFIQKNLWDEARVFSGKPYFFNGIKAPKMTVSNSKSQVLKGDHLDIFYN